VVSLVDWSAASAAQVSVLLLFEMYN